MTPAKTLPDQLISAGDDGCGTVNVLVKTSGGRSGDPLYAGGYIIGHVGHAASLMSAEQMRRLAAALVQAADAIDAAGLPSYQQTRSR